MNVALSGALWLFSVAANGWLLFGRPSKMSNKLLFRLVGAVSIATPVCAVAFMLVLAAIGAHPSIEFRDGFFSVVFTVALLTMLTSINRTFHGMVDTVIAFHERVNRANLHRFPIAFLIQHRAGLKRFGTVAWFGGGALMLFGVWLHKHVSA
jgi:hypothetical protein